MDLCRPGYGVENIRLSGFLDATNESGTDRPQCIDNFHPSFDAMTCTVKSPQNKTDQQGICSGTASSHDMKAICWMIVLINNFCNTFLSKIMNFMNFVICIKIEYGCGIFIYGLVFCRLHHGARDCGS